ncbi:MAG: aminotransferase class V-fold PLP-dependent enzyme [Armatimonadetes bacterium]|nr:aminotransferase class V-fold PLP-dependent enzyme [Armatimonadota bacterium]
MDPANYFDHAATTRVCEAAQEAMLPWYGPLFGNAHSLHSWGTRARDSVESARELIASLLGAEDPSQIIFTSGATEACNTMVRLASGRRSQVSPFEHAAVREPASRAGIPLIPNQGFRLHADPERTAIVTACCNETGAIFNHSGDWYCDATQAIGKLPVSLTDYSGAAFSAHKFGGPMGVGALFLRDPLELFSVQPLLVGGGQEGGHRAGTLNVPGIVGMAAALEFALQHPFADEAAALRRTVVSGMSAISGICFNDSPMQSPFILSATIPGVVAQPLVEEISRKGFAISSGPACSSGSTDPSPVLTSLGLTESEALSTIRISFGHGNTDSSASALSSAICETVFSLRPELAP